MRWEYRIIKVLSTADLDPAYYNAAEELHDAWVRLHAEGQEGWELVSVDSGVAYFKRVSRRWIDEQNEIWRKKYCFINMAGWQKPIAAFLSLISFIILVIGVLKVGLGKK